MPEGVPDELKVIATTAMSRDTAQRYASVAQMREALEDYLVHSDSIALAATARERLAELRDDVDESVRDRLASEAEFGFRQALHVWSGNAGAREGLQDLLELRIEADLAKESWHAASQRLASLPEPRPELERRVQALKESSALQAQELQQRRDDVDLGRAAKQRSVMAGVGAVGWTLALVGLGILNRQGLVSVGILHLLAVTSVAAVIFLAMVFWGRRQLFANVINRQMVGLLGLGWLFGLAYWIGAWVIDAPFREAIVGIVPLICFVPAAGAVAVDTRLRPAAAVAIAGSLIHPFFASYTLEILGAVGGSVLLMLSLTWRRPE